jgi:hypothetical protein
VHLAVIFVRATMLCAAGIGVYVTLARVFGVHELAEIESILLRRLKLRFQNLLEHS